MKLSSMILLGTFSLLLVAMVVSNILLKKEYDKIDKSDSYWNFNKIPQQPFRHLKIDGGNFTNITFEQSSRPSVSIFKNWEGSENNLVKATVINDTLFVSLSVSSTDPGERDYMQGNTLVHISSPELLSVDGWNTNIILNKLQ